MNDINDIELLIDRSASMSSMFEQTIIGVENFVKDQKKTAKETGILTNITIKSFDDEIEIMSGFNSQNILDTNGIDHNCLKPRGGTKLFDIAHDSLLSQREDI